jgi:sugar phosphate permease
LRWVPIVTTTILTSLLTTGAQAGYYAVFTWLPTFVRTEPKLTVLGTGGYIAMVIIGSFVGYLVSAYLTDRICSTRRRVQVKSSDMISQSLEIMSFVSLASK